MADHPEYIGHLVSRYPAIGAMVFAELLRQRRIPSDSQMFYAIELWESGSGRAARHLIRPTARIIGSNVLALMYFVNTALAKRGNGRAAKKVMAAALNRIPVADLDEQLDTTTVGPVTIRTMIYRAMPRAANNKRRAFYASVIEDTRQLLAAGDTDAVYRRS